MSLWLFLELNSLLMHRSYKLSLVLTILYFTIDVGDFMLMTIFGFWRNFDIETFFGCWCPTLVLEKIGNVGDENGQNRHQHLKVIANTFRPQHPSPTSMLPARTSKIFQIQLRLKWFCVDVDQLGVFERSFLRF